jgi:hypothetical protein
MTAAREKPRECRKQQNTPPVRKCRQIRTIQHVMTANTTSEILPQQMAKLSEQDDAC